ncbi:Strictosidine synthase 1 [Hordeum vulgare]|nr:Strictosidine synthase 1 [Hordeum vulgare]
MRGHGTTVKMVYDERYAPFYKRALLLGFVMQFKPWRRNIEDGSIIRMSRQKNQSIVDWGEIHVKYVQQWNERQGRKDRERRVLDWDDYEAHRLCYDDGNKYCLRLRPQWTTEDIKDLYDDDSDSEAYNDNIRELKGGFREYAPLMNRILNKSIFEASDVLSSIHGTRDSENKLRESMKIVKKCRKLVGLLGCATSSVQEDEEEEDEDEEDADEEDEEEQDAEDEAEEDGEEEDDEERA